MDLFDAHNHFQDPRLDAWRDELARRLPETGLREMMVNGLREADWPRVAELARRHSWARPAFGLHPWRVRERTPDWQERLKACWQAFPHAAVGETGLDRWIENPDIETQAACFRWQLEQAAKENRPLTVHCLRAFGLLEEILRDARRPERGFLLHSYGGPAEMVPVFARLGAYFSVSPYFFHERKRAQLEVFKSAPRERLLIETDAPDMRPPAALNPNPLALPDGREINSPANLAFCYEQTAALLGMPLGELAEQVAENYRRWAGGAFHQD